MLKHKHTGFLYQQPDDKEAGDPPPDPENRDENGSGKDYEDKDGAITALEKRLAEAKEELRTLRDETKDYKALKDAQKKMLEEQGNFKALYEDTQSKNAELAPKAEAYEILLNEIRDENKARIANLPADQQGSIALIAEKLSPQDLRKFLNDAEGSIIGQRKAPDTGAGRGVDSGGGKSIVLTAEESAMAKRAGMTDEQYAEAKSKISGN